MDHPENTFAGWTVDVPATHTFWPARLKKFSFFVPVAVLAATFLVSWAEDAGRISKQDGTEFARYLILVFILWTAFFVWISRREQSMRACCSGCGKAMERIETYPKIIEIEGAESTVIGESGHVYRLIKVPRTGLLQAVEIRLRWQGCEACKHYLDHPVHHQIDLGIGREAIAQQEATYARLRAAASRYASKKTGQPARHRHKS